MPLKAALGFLLSVAAAFGVVVAVFQWGWFAEPLSVDTTGPIISFMPILLMGILFGLAMDYEVFLVSGMREAYVRTARRRADAVVDGFAARRARGHRGGAHHVLRLRRVRAPRAPRHQADRACARRRRRLDAFLVRMTLVPGA